MPRFRALLVLLAGVLAPIVAAIALGRAAIAGGYRVNVSSSIPLGLYRRARVADLSRGTFVSVCLSGRGREIAVARMYTAGIGACGDSMPIFKQIVGVPGDVVVVEDTGVMIDGRSVPRSAPLASDHEHRPLPRLRGRFVVPSRHVWLAGTSALSFDSRYFGAVESGWILEAIQPVWISR